MSNNTTCLPIELEYEDMDFSTKLIAMLYTKSIPYKNNLLDITCIVCCSSGVSSCDYYQLPCDHYGHVGCITRYLNSKKDYILTHKKILCPECKDNIPDTSVCQWCEDWVATKDIIAVNGGICPSCKPICNAMREDIYGYYS